MQCGMVPTGTCARVLLGMVQADRDRSSDLMHHGGRRLWILVRPQVKAASVGLFLSGTEPTNQRNAFKLPGHNDGRVERKSAVSDLRQDWRG